MKNTKIGMGIVVIMLAILATYRGGIDLLSDSVGTGLQMLIQIIPLLILAFIIAGQISVLISAETISRWLGEGAGWKGPVLGALTGALVPGGPFTFFPLFDAIFKANVGTGTAIAMITGWGMLNVGHLPWEFAFLGPRFVMLKYGIYIAVPPLTGLIAHLLFS